MDEPLRPKAHEEAFEDSIGLQPVLLPACTMEPEGHPASFVDKVVERLKERGAVIVTDCVGTTLLDDCRDHILAMTDEISGTAMSSDGGVEADKVDKKKWGIRRLARIGTGKTNIHFDQYGASPCHDAMARLGEASGMATLIREYCGDDCSLSETGVSLTGPRGGGLEWHIDGAEGECTMIMSLDDVEPEQGMLGLVLGSHVMLDRDADEDFDVQIENVVAKEDRSAYAYRAGQPIVFDARLIHCAEASKSERQRVILWWIFNGGN